MVNLSAFAPDTFRGLRRADYDRLVEAGAFDEDERLELLRGVIVSMSPQHARHSEVIQRLTRLLILALPERLPLRVQLPLLATDDSEPEPDFAIVPSGDYRARHPDRALVVIEVADSSVNKDRTVKGPIYAECGVPEYWIVNLADDVVEVHTDIRGGEYRQIQRYRRGERIVCGSVDGLALEVSDFLL